MLKPRPPPVPSTPTVLKINAPKSAYRRHTVGIVEAIGKLYAHERTQREANAPPEVRWVNRQEHGAPVLALIKQKIESAQTASMPISKLAKACAYVLGQRPKLTRFFDYGEVELDTNWAEPKHRGDGQPIGCPKGEAKPGQNSVRPLVLGRKN